MTCYNATITNGKYPVDDQELQRCAQPNVDNAKTSMYSRKTPQPIALFRAYQMGFCLFLHRTAALLSREISTPESLTSALKPMLDLQCYAGANNRRLSGPLIILATLCIPCQCLLIWNDYLSWRDSCLLKE
jgi:hypothetical protein